mmetsp:Transcript_34669/g.53100  ORF Transcript_34669/g.53100 Transcript_34669/m.53100 type:complete len:122 (+) Transcript_34669:1154-1519(+)
MDRAVGDYNEMRDAIAKMDEARLYMNKLMGPQGPLSEAQRDKFFGPTVKDNDQLLKQIGNSPYQGGGRLNELTASAGGLNPVRSESNLQAKNYFNNAGIAGSNSMTPAKGEAANEEDAFWY